MAPYLLFCGTVLAAWLVRMVIGSLRILHSIGYLPGHRTFIDDRSTLYYLLPRIKYVTLGKNPEFLEGHSTFAKAGWDAYTSISWWPSLWCTISLADAAAIKDIATSRRFPKPVFMYEALDLFGRNIVSTEGELWKKYRRISTPSFSERNNKLVWEETLRLVEDLTENTWGNKDAVVDHAVDVTLPLALLVIGAAGFGQRVSWEEDVQVKPPPNYQLTFRDALHTTASDIILNALIPDWMKSFHPRMRKLRLATKELKAYMHEMIIERQGSDVHDSHDLLSSLIRANKEETDGTSLSEDELMGNVFIFLVAGHETTAHTLAFTLGLLALYPEVQEKLLNHIREVIPNGRRPVYGDMLNLTYAMAVYYETLRMFPPVNVIPKVAPEDTSIIVGNCFNAGTRRIPFPKGTSIYIHVPGLHNNPRYWKNPELYDPDRFLGSWNRDALMTFSVGPRACVGRKFNETEAIAALVSIISRYKVEIKDEPEFKHEAFEERKARVLSTKMVLTLAPKRLPLIFRKRVS